MKIEMVDLKREYRNLKAELLPAVEEVMESAAFIKGPAVDRFSRNVETLLDVPHHIPCANGTDALKLSLMALGIKPGDEVITTPFTFVATAEVIAFFGAVPVFTDIQPDTLLMDPARLEEAITPRTKAIIPVHLFGQMADMDAVMAIAVKHGLKVVEDTAQAFYASRNGKYAGTVGDIGTISYFPSKNLGAYGDAGGLLCSDDDLAQKITMIANHGQKKKYEHHLIGVNSRLDTMQAAILDVKLKYIKEWSEKRLAAAKKYMERLSPAVQLPVIDQGNVHVFHQFTIQHDRRDDLKDFLETKGVPSAVHYPIPLHRQPGFTSLCRIVSASLSEKAADRVLSLPISPWITDEEIDYVCEQVNTFVNNA